MRNLRIAAGIGRPFIMKNVALMLCIVSTTAFAAGAKSVASGFVPVCAPGEACRPIPNAAGGRETTRLVDTTNVFTAAYVKDFEVDGDVSKPEWKGAELIDTFLPIKGRGEFGYATELKLLYSDTALYIGATFFQPMAELLAKYDQDDQPVYNDDCLEVMLFVPAGKGENLIHIAVNALGSCWDAVNSRPVWNVRRRKIAAKRYGDRWTLEMKMPFTSLHVERPLPGDFIGARFCRVVHAPKHGRGYIPQLLTIGNDQRHRFGKLTFGMGAESGCLQLEQGFIFIEKFGDFRVEAGRVVRDDSRDGGISETLDGVRFAEDLIFKNLVYLGEDAQFSAAVVFVCRDLEKVTGLGVGVFKFIGKC